MTPFEHFIQWLVSIGPQAAFWGMIKILFLLGFFLYIAFALVVIRQTSLMTKTLIGGFAAPIKIVVLAHLGVAIAVFLLALMIL